MMSRESTGGGGGGGTNAGAPPLTTPTLTPTTLRNIEQMFADRDPHEPPPHHENAAGFVPPIIRWCQHWCFSSLISESVFSPSSGSSFFHLGPLVSPPQETQGRPKLSELPSPASLLEFLPELTNGRNGSSKLAGRTPGRVRPVLPTSPIPLESPALPPLVQKLSSLPPPLLVKTPCPDLTISVRNSDNKERERPPSLQLGPLNGALINKVSSFCL